MPVTLIQRRVRADAVEVLAAVHVPGPDAFGTRDDDGQRGVVGRAHLVGARDDRVVAAHKWYFPGTPLARARISSPNKLSTSSTASSAVRLPSSNAGLSSMMSSDRMRPES